MTKDRQCIQYDHGEPRDDSHLGWDRVGKQEIIHTTQYGAQLKTLFLEFNFSRFPLTLVPETAKSRTMIQTDYSKWMVGCCCK